MGSLILKCIYHSLKKKDSLFGLDNIVVSFMPRMWHWMHMLTQSKHFRCWIPRLFESQ